MVLCILQEDRVKVAAGSKQMEFEDESEAMCCWQFAVWWWRSVGGSLLVAVRWWQFVGGCSMVAVC